MTNLLRGMTIFSSRAQVGFIVTYDYLGFAPLAELVHVQAIPEGLKGCQLNVSTSNQSQRFSPPPSCW